MESQQPPPPATPPPFVPGNFATVASNVFGVYYSNGVFTLSFRDLRDVGGRGAVIEVGRFATGPDGMAWLASMILAALRSYHEPQPSQSNTPTVRPPNIDELIASLEEELRRQRPSDSGGSRES
jgi:hypothetical protein